jgi:hypothetical protein
MLFFIYFRSKRRLFSKNALLNIDSFAAGIANTKLQVSHLINLFLPLYFHWSDVMNHLKRWLGDKKFVRYSYMSPSPYVTRQTTTR